MAKVIHTVATAACCLRLAGACCPSGQTCVSNQCVAPGSTACGGAVCSPGLTCQGGIVCCSSGQTFCNNGCCAQGNTCINNQCVPSGSSACGATVVCPVNQFCGNSLTGLCCQMQSGMQSQIACGNTCCQFNQICNTFTQQCVAAGTIIGPGGGGGGVCRAGEFWCSGARRCCPLGWTCGVGSCLPGRG